MKSVHLHILNASGVFDPVATLIEDEFIKSLKKISSALFISDVDVVVYDNPKGVISEIGIGGYSPNGHVLFVSLDAKSPILTKIIREQLKRTLAHELHHCMRWRNPGYGKTLIEALASEGLADHFDLEINGGSPQPWCTALDKREISSLSKKAEQEYHAKKYDHRAWFFGSEPKAIPRWAGYTLGYNLVKNYLAQHPGQFAASLVNKPVEEML